MAVDNGKGGNLQNGANISVKSISPQIQETMNYAIQNEDKVIKI